MTQKRYEYWASDNGKPIKKWTEFFIWDSDSTEPIQLKGYKGNDLKNEYKKVS